MTADEQIANVRADIKTLEQRHESRIHTLEEGIATDIRRIFEKLEQQAEDRSISKERLEHLTAAHNATMLRMERQEIKVLEIERHMLVQFHKVEKTKAWLVGLWSGVAFFASILGAGIAIAVNWILGRL